MFLDLTTFYILNLPQRIFCCIYLVYIFCFNLSSWFTLWFKLFLYRLLLLDSLYYRYIHFKLSIHFVFVIFQNVAQYETVIRVLEEEKEYYKREYEMIKATKKTLSSARATPTKVWKKTYSCFVIAKIDAFQIHYAPKKIHCLNSLINHSQVIFC